MYLYVVATPTSFELWVDFNLFRALLNFNLLPQNKKVLIHWNGSIFLRENWSSHLDLINSCRKSPLLVIFTATWFLNCQTFHSHGWSTAASRIHLNLYLSYFSFFLFFFRALSLLLSFWLLCYFVIVLNFVPFSSAGGFGWGHVTKFIFPNGKKENSNFYCTDFIVSNLSDRTQPNFR